MKIKQGITAASAALLVALLGMVPAASAATGEPVATTYFKEDFSRGQTIVPQSSLQGLRDQTTDMGRKISALSFNQGKVYVGYGDYTANTGPIDLYSYDGVTGAANFELKIPTESVEHFPEINGKLYAPYIDPKAPWTSKVGYATNAGGSWQLNEPVTMIHNYDMASTNGTNLFMAGSIQEGGKFYAAIWYSADGKTNWQVIRKVASPTSRGELDRYYWLETENGKLYAMADVSGTRKLDIWDNGTWTSKTLSSDAAMLLNVQKAGEIALIGGHLISNLSANPLGNFTNAVYSIASNSLVPESSIKVENTKVNVPDPQPEPDRVQFQTFKNYGGKLYALSAGQVYYSSDGVNWSYLLTGPNSLDFALDFEGGRAYFASIDDNPGIAMRDIPAARNQNPEITMDNYAPVLAVGQSWNPMAGVRAVDPEDGDLTSKITGYAIGSENGAVDTSQPGQVYYGYSVDDSRSANTTVFILVTVKEGALPPSSPGSTSDGFCMVAKDSGGRVGSYGGLACAGVS